MKNYKIKIAEYRYHDCVNGDTHTVIIYKKYGWYEIYVDCSFVSSSYSFEKTKENAATIIRIYT